MTVVNSKATVMEWKAKLTAKIELDSQSLESGMDHVRITPSLTTVL